MTSKKKKEKRKEKNKKRKNKNKRKAKEENLKQMGKIMVFLFFCLFIFSPLVISSI